MDYGTVLTNCSNSEEARAIAKSLVENKLAACVNIIPKITSIYSWKDEIVEDEEYLLFIKTRKNHFRLVKKEIRRLHSYELPEIIMLQIKKGSKEYLEWIKSETSMKDS